MEMAWDIPLFEGYAHEFIPIAHRPKRMGFWETDNPTVRAELSIAFSPTWSPFLATPTAPLGGLHSGAIETGVRC